MIELGLTLEARRPELLGEMQYADTYRPAHIRGPEGMAYWTTTRNRVVPMAVKRTALRVRC